MTWPRVIGVELRGTLRPWVSAKDIILRLLSVLTTRGNVGCVVEYFGPGVATLPVPARATCTNMGAELGVTASVFPSDDVTKGFLIAQGSIAPKTHDLELLLNKCADFDRSLSKLKYDCQELNVYAALSRYPEGQVPPEQKCREMVEAAQRIKTEVVARLG
jgi:aconitase A